MKRLFIPLKEPKASIWDARTLIMETPGSVEIIDAPENHLLSRIALGELDKTYGKPIRTAIYFLVFNRDTHGPSMLLIGEAGKKLANAPILRVDQGPKSKVNIHYAYNGSRGQLSLPDPTEGRPISNHHQDLRMKEGTFHLVDLSGMMTNDLDE